MLILCARNCRFLWFSAGIFVTIDRNLCAPEAASHSGASSANRSSAGRTFASAVWNASDASRREAANSGSVSGPGGSLNAEPLTTVSASECRISTGSNRCLKSWSKRGKSCLRRCESVIKLVSACRRNKQSLINVSGSMSIWETSVVLIDHNIMLPPKFSRILLEAYLRPIRDFTPESRTWQV